MAFKLIISGYYLQGDRKGSDKNALKAWWRIKEEVITQRNDQRIRRREGVGDRERKVMTVLQRFPNCNFKSVKQQL